MSVLMDRRCGTCASGIKYLVSCCDRENQHSGLHQPDDTCQDYVERTDSLEQVTLEMWRDLGRSIKYADRLRALGVEVPQ